VKCKLYFIFTGIYEDEADIGGKRDKGMEREGK